MIMKECNSAAWLKQVERRADRIKAALAVGQCEAAWSEAHELVAAAQILQDEIAVESKTEKSGG